jgi:hypothetical protein
MNRRTFLSLSGASLASFYALGQERELHADVVVIGAGVGGVAAALAAARSGYRVLLTEETPWIGGQFTAQAVPPDEHPWIEMFGCTRAYRGYRNGVRRYYREHFPLTAAARSNPTLNPGNGSVSRLTHDPRVSLAVLEAMLAPYAANGQLRILLGHRAVAADAHDGRVRSVEVQPTGGGVSRVLHGDYFLDATELGDLLPLAHIGYFLGSESSRSTGEPHAPTEARPGGIQGITYCFAMEYRPGEDHTIERPRDYAFWRDYVPALRPPWPGKLLSWTAAEPRTLKPRTHAFDPLVNEHGGDGGLWTYRRILDPGNFTPGYSPAGITLVNWPQNDYWLKSIVDVAPEAAARAREEAKQLSFSLLYWLQTEAPRPDGAAGWKGLRLRADVVGSDDGLALYPYIREGRRLLAEFTILEQHVGTEARAALTGKPRQELTAEVFTDSVGIGSYRIDLHPSTGGENYVDISSLPFQIPFGALIPRSGGNLLAAAKNIGTTHISNGCYRLHPVEWNIGEAAGMAAAEALRMRSSPSAIRASSKALAEFQRNLAAAGFELSWPRLSPR